MKRQQDAPASSDRAELEQQIVALRLDVRRLQLEKDVLKKASELLKKRTGHRPAAPDESREDTAG